MSAVEPGHAPDRILRAIRAHNAVRRGDHRERAGACALHHDVPPTSPTTDLARDRKLVRDAGIAIVMFGALGVFVVALFVKYSPRPIPWQAWVVPGAVLAVGGAILARSVAAAWIAFAMMAVLGVGGAIGVVRDGGSPVMIAIWPAVAGGVCAMLYRAIAAMRRLRGVKGP